MRKVRWLVVCVVCFCYYGGFGAFGGELPLKSWEQDIKVIEQAVSELIDLRNKELAKAAWEQNQGDRLQFHPQNLIDARRYWDSADASRKRAEYYQYQIDKLEARRKELLKKRQ